MLSRPFQRGFHLFQTSGFRKLNQRNICCTSDRTPVVNYFSSFNFSESIAWCGCRPGFCGESCSETPVPLSQSPSSAWPWPCSLCLKLLLQRGLNPSICITLPSLSAALEEVLSSGREGHSHHHRTCLSASSLPVIAKVVILNLTGGIRRPTTWCYVGQDLQIPASWFDLWQLTLCCFIPHLFSLIATAAVSGCYYKNWIRKMEEVIPWCFGSRSSCLTLWLC